MTTRMQLRNNLKGRRFGTLVVVSQGKSTGGIGAQSVCTCDCGRNEVVWNHLLLKGRKLRCDNCLTPKSRAAQ